VPDPGLEDGEAVVPKGPGRDTGRASRRQRRHVGGALGDRRERLGDHHRWTPTIPTARSYDVYVRWTSHPNRSARVPVTVRHASGSTVRYVDERVNGGAWVLHGRYSFAAGTGGYVSVSDANGQAAADAVRFVPVP
jgi:hypothetical protein